jgi:hypothetical protein
VVSCTRQATVSGCAWCALAIPFQGMTAVHHHGHWVRVRKVRMKDEEFVDFLISGASLLAFLLRWAIILFGVFLLSGGPGS